MVDDRYNQAIEVLVEHLHQVVARHPFGHRGEALKIGEQNDRRDHLERATPYLAVQNLPAGDTAYVGVQKVDGDVLGDPCLDSDRQFGHEMGKKRQLTVAEAAGCRCRPGGDHAGHVVRRAIPSISVQMGDVIGGAFGAELLADGEGQRFISLQPDTQMIEIAVEQTFERARQIGFGRFRPIEKDVGSDAVFRSPGAAENGNTRMQRLRADIATHQRQSDDGQSLAKTFEQGFEAGTQKSLLADPVAKRRDVGCGRKMTQGQRSYG